METDPRVEASNFHCSHSALIISLIPFVFTSLRQRVASLDGWRADDGDGECVGATAGSSGRGDGDDDDDDDDDDLAFYTRSDDGPKVDIHLRPNSHSLGSNIDAMEASPVGSIESDG